MVLVLREKTTKKIIAKFSEDDVEMVDTENFVYKNGDLEEKASGKRILTEFGTEELLLMDCKNYELVSQKEKN